SSAGIRPSRTASYWKITSYPVSSKPRSRPSSTTTTTAVTTRASTISPQPMSTADAVQPSWQNGKGSNDRLLPTAACSINCGPSNSTTSVSQNLPYFTRLVVPKTLTTDSAQIYQAKPGRMAA